jgi:hypothetical protein
VNKYSSFLPAIVLICCVLNCGRSPVQYQTSDTASPATESHASYDWYGAMGSIAVYKTPSNDLIANGTTYLVGGVDRFEVNDGWIVALLNDQNKNLIGKIGLNGSWVPIDYNVDAFRVSNGFIGELKSGVLWVKFGMDGKWVNELSNVKDFRMYSTGSPDFTLVALMNDGSLLGKSGINGNWVFLKGAIKDFRIDGSYIAALDNDGYLWGKTGLNGNWMKQILYMPITKFDMSRNGDVLILANNGTLYYKYGLTGSLWTYLNTNIKDFEAVSEWAPGFSSSEPFFYLVNVVALGNDNLLHFNILNQGSIVPPKSGNDVIFSNVQLFNLFGCSDNKIVTARLQTGAVWTWNRGATKYWGSFGISSFMQW